jgi:hypothetical protein
MRSGIYLMEREASVYLSGLDMIPLSFFLNGMDGVESKGTTIWSFFKEWGCGRNILYQCFRSSLEWNEGSGGSSIGLTIRRDEWV